MGWVSIGGQYCRVGFRGKVGFVRAMQGVNGSRIGIGRRSGLR